MAPLQIFLSSFLLFAVLLWSLVGIATSTENCPIESCSSSSSGDGGGAVGVKFPFQIIRNLGFPISNPRCGYPGFQLFCLPNQTFIVLPRSGPFTVLNIDYNFQTLYINDPQNCLPRRYLNDFSLLDSPFFTDVFINVTFLNCSSSHSSSKAAGIEYDEYTTVPCLSSDNHTVLTVASKFFNESTLPSSSCEVIKKDVMVPGSLDYWIDIEDAIRLTWAVPFCANCEFQGQVCGFKSDSGLAAGCSDSSGSGMSRGKKYAVMIGVGVPGTLFIIVLGCYLCGKAGTHDSQRRGWHRPITELSVSIALPPSAIVVPGLDRPTIESYPKTLLGESKRLPKPNDNTCSICLSEYEPKETLRTIPECNHYFHAECIDKWLRMNASCPVCRNSPDGSSSATPSSTSTSSRSSSV